MSQSRSNRRTILQQGLLLSVGGWTAAVAGCATADNRPPGPASTAPTPIPTGGFTTAAKRVLLAYFSRPGENYYYGGRRDLQVGNTEVLAGMIAELVACDVHRIEAADPYPAGYDATVARNIREQDTDARPAIANPLAAIDQYDTVLLGSPIWNVRPPMIMTTFTEGHDFNGKTVYPFVTYAVSGLGSTDREYTATCPGAKIAPGLAIRGEEVTQHRSDVETWLRVAGLLVK